MKFFICLLMFPALLCAIEDQNGYDESKSDWVDPNFYNQNLIEIDGHVYRIILCQHHRSCHCFQKTE